MKIALVIFSIIGFTAMAYAETSKNCLVDPTICSDQQCCVREEDVIREGRFIIIRNVTYSCRSFQREGESCYLDSSVMQRYYFPLCPCMPNLTCLPNEETTTVEYVPYNYSPDGTCKNEEIN